MRTFDLRYHELGGQRQLGSLPVHLSWNFKFVIADEPISALDVHRSCTKIKLKRPISLLPMTCQLCTSDVLQLSYKRGCVEVAETDNSC